MKIISKKTNSPSHPIDISSAPIARKTAPEQDKIFSDHDAEIIELKKRYASLNSTIDSIVAKLKEYIIGQDKALRIVAFIVYNNLFLNMLEDTCGFEIEHINGLIIGPSGTGKTATIRALAKLFKVPFTYFNATGLTASGYVGGQVEAILNTHFANCGYDINKAQNGIIYIDEIDKLRSSVANNTSGKDINGTAVQQELLKILEPSQVSVGKDNIQLDTHRLTIICGGKFDGLNEVRKNRLHGKKKTGFGSNPKPRKSYDYDDNDIIATFFDDLQSPEFVPNDLIEYGFIDEFVGRFTLYAEYKPLSFSDIEDIIYSKHSFLSQYMNVFYSRGVDLIVDPLLLHEIAISATQSKIGARDIKRKLLTLLLPALYDTEQNYCPGICEINDDLQYTSVFEQRETQELLTRTIVDLANRTDLKPSN